MATATNLSAPYVTPLQSAFGVVLSVQVIPSVDEAAVVPALSATNFPVGAGADKCPDI
jgi:hypothetical protein